MPNELEPIKNEVQRKVGRNLLLFQQVEHMIKWLLANTHFEGYVSELTLIRDRQAKLVKKKTLGQLIHKYIEVEASQEESKGGPERLKEPWLAFTTSLEADSNYFESKTQALAALNNERNELVHHLLPRLKPQALESWIEVEQYLDNQREKILPELKELQNRIKAIEEGRNTILKFIRSDEGIAWLTGQKEFKKGTQGIDLAGTPVD